MAKASLGTAWEETVAFVKREGTLLFPVALLFIALPAALLQYLMPDELVQWMEQRRTNPLLAMPDLPDHFVAVAIAAPLVALFGTMAVYALSLRGGISVAEALGLGLKRLPILIAAGIVLMAAFLLVIMVAGLLMAFMGLVLPKGLAAVLMLVVTFGCIGFTMMAGVRLLLLNAVIVDRPIGPLDSLRQSWRLTRGAFWRLLAFVFVMLIVLTIMSQAAQVAFGVLAGLIGGASAAKLVGALAAALVSAIVQVYALVMAARLYRQLEA